MMMKSICLYEHYKLQKPAEARAELVCLYDNSPAEMELHRKRPGVLILPGGGYTFVSDREAGPVALEWMAKGYAAFILRYSVEPLSFPVQLREACMAMRYIRENCDRFEVNPHMVAAIGFSAGGHLCGTLGTMYDCPEVSDLGEGAMLRPDAIGLCYPVALTWGPTHEGSVLAVSGGDAALAKRLSVDAQVRPDMPPVYLWHTRDDATVPARNSLILAQALQEAGVPYALHIYHSGPHGLATADQRTCSTEHYRRFSREITGWANRMMDFFEEIGFCAVDA